MPEREASEPANLRPLTGTGTGAAFSSSYVPGLSRSSWLDRSTSSARLTSTLTRVDVALTTSATDRLPSRVRPSYDSTASPSSMIVIVNGAAPSASSATSSGVTWIAMFASGSTDSIATGRPSARSAAGSAARAGSPAGSAFGTRTM